MKTIKIFGAQDYLVCIDGDISSNYGTELNSLTHPLLREHGYFGILHISGPEDDSGLYVHPIYSGNWSFAISPAEEDGSMPDWSIRRSWGSINAHSETIELTVPNGAILRVLAPIESQPKEPS
jgi:hypothetical protein